MIGLTALAIVVIWCFLAFQLARRLPKWLGVQKSVLRMVLSVVAFTVFMIGPFVDHIVGMWQFQKLCKEQTGLQIYPGAVNTKRGREVSSEADQLNEYFIPIKRITHSLLDLDTGEVIARHYQFTTPGGKVGGMARLGGGYQCTVFQSDHPDQPKYRALRSQIAISYGERK